MPITASSLSSDLNFCFVGGTVILIDVVTIGGILVGMIAGTIEGTMIGGTMTGTGGDTESMNQM